MISHKTNGQWFHFVGSAPRKRAPPLRIPGGCPSCDSVEFQDFETSIKCTRCNMIFPTDRKGEAA